MHPAFRRLANRRLALALNLTLMAGALLASLAKGAMVAGAIPFALLALAVYTDNPSLQRASLGISGLVVGSGFLVATVGTYGEFLAGNWRGEALVVGSIMAAVTLPTFLHLYSRHTKPPPAQ